MARPSKPSAPKAGSPGAPTTTATFPSLHPAVAAAPPHGLIRPAPWFTYAGNDRDAMEAYSTTIMGEFECRNPCCPQTVWASKKIGIRIRRFRCGGYDAVVFKQRCRSCEEIGAVRIDEGSYVERVVYRLRRWAGVSCARPTRRCSGAGNGAGV
jgi:hypothetical protein